MPYDQRMQRIRPHLGLARNVRISNVWLLQDGYRRFLVDTGHPVERAALKLHLWKAGIRGRGDLDGVILTHRHSDHAGNARWLRRTYDCPVYCHAEDAPYLMGETPPPRLARPETPIWARVLCHVEDAFPARVEVDGTFDDGEWKFGLRVFHVPGHTAGSSLIHHEPTRTLFSGDTIISGPPTFRLIERMRLSFDEFSEDGPGARRAARAVLEQLPPTETLCSGHGPTVCDGTHHKLLRLREMAATRARVARNIPSAPDS